MILGFKKRFAPLVQDGSKTHTIRDDAKGRWKAGNWVDAFAKVRQKGQYRLIDRTKCLRVETIRVYTEGTQEVDSEAFWIHVEVNGVRLTLDEKDLLAWRDGFRMVDGAAREYLAEPGDKWSANPENCFTLMSSYWMKEKTLPYDGKLIHWK